MRADDHGASPVTTRRRYRRQVTLRDVAAELPLPPAGLLPTPTASNPNDAEDPARWLDRRTHYRDRRINGNGMGMPLSIAVRLLPTPLASEATAGSPNQRDSSGHPGLSATVLRLLPTPCAFGNRNSRTAVTVHRSGPGLEQAVELVLGIAPDELDPDHTPLSWTRPHRHDPDPTTLGWGDYTPAIHRWAAVLDRRAPHPTEPGRTGRPRLAPQFVEWLMGLPAGWVTDTGISRAAQIRTLGNGVVPTQAAAAVTLLLNDLAHDSRSAQDPIEDRRDAAA